MVTKGMHEHRADIAEEVDGVCQNVPAIITKIASDIDAQGVEEHQGV